MENYHFKKTEQINRRRAFWFAFFVHLLIFGAVLIASSAEGHWKDHLPDQLKEWLDMEEQDQPEVKAKPRA